jgi:DNA-binding response OmpR family regulator
MEARYGELTVLSVSSCRADRLWLRRLFDHTNWTLWVAETRAEAAEVLQRAHVPVVICDDSLRDGGWEDVLRLTTESEDPPLLIVASRVADDSLWAEVLNLGGYTVLDKPFDRTELTRVVSLAYRQHHETCTRFQCSAVPARAVGAVAGHCL